MAVARRRLHHLRNQRLCTTQKEMRYRPRSVEFLFHQLGGQSWLCRGFLEAPPTRKESLQVRPPVNNVTRCYALGPAHQKDD
jgi:hypothetical protein